MFEVIKTEGTARRGRFRCAHGGEVQTPVFMNVGTQGAIKGGIDAFDLKELGCQIELSNTYHLHLRPGDDVVRQMGWTAPVHAVGRPHPDGLRRLSGVLSGGSAEDHGGGRYLRQPSGRPPHFHGAGGEYADPVPSGSDIAMAFDECVENPAQYDYAKASCERTLRWLERCKAEHDRLNALPDTVNPHQMLFGINQGATYRDLRIWHMQQIAKLNCDGYAIGGLAVGEPTEVMYDIIEAVEPICPRTSPGISWVWGPPATSSRAWPVVWISSTALCRPATPDTESSLHGRVP